MKAIARNGDFYLIPLEKGMSFVWCEEKPFVNGVMPIGSTLAHWGGYFKETDDEFNIPDEFIRKCWLKRESYGKQYFKKRI